MRLPPAAAHGANARKKRALTLGLARRRLLGGALGDLRAPPGLGLGLDARLGHRPRRLGHACRQADLRHVADAEGGGRGAALRLLALLRGGRGRRRRRGGALRLRRGGPLRLQLLRGGGGRRGGLGGGRRGRGGLGGRGGGRWGGSGGLGRRRGGRWGRRGRRRGGRGRGGHGAQPSRLRRGGARVLVHARERVHEHLALRHQLRHVDGQLLLRLVKPAPATAPVGEQTS